MAKPAAAWGAGVHSGPSGVLLKSMSRAAARA